MSTDLLVPLEAHLSPPRRAAGSLLLEREVSGIATAPPTPVRPQPAPSADATSDQPQKDRDGNTRALPAGLVTFVFTDIEGSTRLYKALGQRAAERVFDTHNAILRGAWARFGGHEVHTEGDSFFVVFQDPNAAVAACVEVQRCLAETPWPIGGEVRVRIGIHRGLAAPRHDNYMALAVHQAARVMSAASGDQIFVTDEVARELRDTSTFRLVRAGSFRLRDFDDAPALHRVDDRARTGNEQPPRATPAKSHNLVPPLTSFVGRDADLDAVIAALGPRRAVTVVGPGGMGKTRLGIEAGLRVVEQWADGVWFVELADIEPERIPQAIAQTIGIGSGCSDDRWTDVLEALADKRILLVLDNAEHLLDELARLLCEFLGRCPTAGVLVTSREPLNCPGETVRRLHSLQVSCPSAGHDEPASVRLFVDRAASALGRFQPDARRRGLIKDICERLDGLPLAIEIAAAQVNMLTLEEILAGLDNRFCLLRSRDRALPDRQRTMEGLLDWSYQLLSDAERRAFERLAVFGGSFSIDAAVAVLSGDDLVGDDVPELVWALVDKSLLVADTSEPATRYRALETVRQYAMGLLDASGGAQTVARSLAEWLLTRIAPWQTHDRRWLGEVGMELSNIRAAVDLLPDEQAQLAQQLMCSIGRYHDSVQNYRSGVEELDRAARTLVARTPSRVALLCELADLHLRMADIDRAAAVTEQAQELQVQVGPPDWNDAALPRSLGEIAMRRGEFAKAVETATLALTGPKLSDRGTARLWSLLGIAQCQRGDLASGLGSLERCLDRYLQLNDIAAIAIAHGNVAEAAWRLGDIAKVAAAQRSCLRIGLAIGQQVAVAHSLIMAARLAQTDHRWDAAVPLYHAASGMLVQAGHELYTEERTAMDEALATAVSALGQGRADELCRAGDDLEVMQAAAVAESIFAALATPTDTTSDNQETP